MKKQIYTIILCALPLAMTAQPTLNKVLDYNPGTTVRFMNCAAVAAGNAGAGQTWNFATLTVNDSTTFTYMAAPTTGNPFAGATLVEKSTDSTLQYFSKGTGTTYLVGMIDSSSDGMGAKMTYTNTALYAMRPLMFNTSASDSFKTNLNVQGFQMNGEGEVKMTADGYGTLILPTGTFTSVLRVKMTRVEKDTIGAPLYFSTVNSITSYVWFDNLHKSPLFRIDSTDSDGSIDATASYLYKEDYPLAVSDVSAQGLSFSAGIHASSLTVVGKFEAGKEYAVAVFNFSGQRLWAGSFTGNSRKQQLDLGSELAPGFYMVSVTETATNTSGIMKLAAY